MKLFHALDICPASPHKSPSIPQRSLPKRQLGLVSLIFITSKLFKLLTFSPGSDTPDWKTPVSKEALQNTESLQKNLKFLKILLQTHRQHKSPSITSHSATGHCKYPGETGNSCRIGHRFLPHASSRGEDPDKPIHWILTRFFRNWFCPHCARPTAAAAKPLQVHSPRVPDVPENLLPHSRGSRIPDANTCLNPTLGSQDQSLPSPPTRLLQRQGSGLCIGSTGSEGPGRCEVWVLSNVGSGSY